MLNPRRRILMAFASAAGLLGVEPLLHPLLAQTGTNPQAKSYPNGGDPSSPGLDERSTLDPVAIQRANQIEIRKDVSKLYEDGLRTEGAGWQNRCLCHALPFLGEKSRAN